MTSPPPLALFFLRPSPAALLTFTVQPPLSSAPVKPDIVDKGDGTYEVKYVAKGNGKHTILVNVRGKPIQNSPFTVEAVRLGMSIEILPLPSDTEWGGVQRKHTNKNI